MCGRSILFIAARSCALFVAILVLATSSFAGGQKNKKKSDTPPPDQSTPVVPQSDNAVIDQNIGEMLGAFQLGETEVMHKYYSDDAAFVSGGYEPPIVGWKNYAAQYDRQRTAFQGVQLIRRDTLIVAHTDTAWATYEWEFDSTANGQSYSLRGHTSLIFNKINGNWLIVFNHTSSIYEPNEPPASQVSSATAPGATATAARP